jgi:hypothetical protein
MSVCRFGPRMIGDTRNHTHIKPRTASWRKLAQIFYFIVTQSSITVSTPQGPPSRNFLPDLFNVPHSQEIQSSKFASPSSTATPPASSKDPVKDVISHESLKRQKYQAICDSVCETLLPFVASNEDMQALNKQFLSLIPLEHMPE